MNSEPTASVTIAVSSSDTTEGTVSATSFVFMATDWNVAQTVTVTGVDDTVFDGTIAYTVILGAASSADSLYNGINPADISLTNTDNDPAPPTKFYVVDDASTNRTYEYDAGGGAVENYSLNLSNATPKGVATNVAGDRIWVVDNNRTVFVYNNSGGLLGSWVAGTIATNAIVEGITTDGTNIWIVDSGTDRVYRYANARTLTAPTLTSFFQLAAGNTSRSGIADPPAGEAFAHRSETLAKLSRENSDIRNFVSAMKSVNTHRMKMLEIVSSQSVNVSKNRSARAKSTSASESDLRDQVFADLRSDWK